MRGAYVAYSPEIAGQVCELLAQGFSLNAVARLEGMPSYSSLSIWKESHAEFREQYLEACARRPKPWPGPRGAYGTRTEIALRREARPAPAPVGRPTAYSEEVAAEICRRVGAGDGTLELGAADDLPCIQSIYNWLEEHEEFRRRYKAACEQRAHLLADEVLAIANDESRDFMPARDGQGLVPNLQGIRRAKLMIDARKWRAAKLAPRKYGWTPAPDPEDEPLSFEDALAQLD